MQEQMKGKPLIRSFSTGKLYPISALRSLPEYARDANGDPLFEDLETDLYISKEYQLEDLTLLEPYGVKAIVWEANADRLESDLAKPDDQSRFRSAEPDSDWQHRALRFVLQLFKLEDGPGLVAHKTRLQNLKLIPAKDGTWNSAALPASPLHFSHVGEIPIPADLGLTLVDGDVLKGPDAEEVLRLFNVKQATVDEIRQLAFTKPSENLEASKARLKFLYLTESPTAVTPAGAWNDFMVYTQKMNLLRPRRSYMFIKNDDPYGPFKLLENIPQSVPGRNVTFINEAYFEDGPEPPTEGALPWSDWILKTLDIERNVPLLSVGAGVGARDYISTYMRFLSSDRQGKFLGALKRAWPQVSENEPRMKLVKDEMSDWKVPCKNGASELIRDTWLPTPDLLEKCAKYLDVEKFPFLKLEELEITATYREEWDFLIQHFDVGHQDDFKFYLKVLTILAQEPPKESQFMAIVDLYRMIKARCLDSSDQKEAERQVRYVPSL